jgi:uncharacterized membrane protein YccC
MPARPVEHRRGLEGGRLSPRLGRVWAIAQEANRYISQARPWTLAKAERAGDRRASEQLDAVLAALAATCHQLAAELAPFLPDAAARIRSQITPVGGALPRPEPVFALAEGNLAGAAAFRAAASASRGEAARPRNGCGPLDSPA